VAAYDRAIPPGGKGKITLTVNTKGYQGRIHMAAVAYTNDPKMSQFTLGVRAFVQVPVLVSPRYVLLQGKAERAVTRTVEIQAGLEKPLAIEPEKFNLEGRVDYDIVEIKKGRFYRVHFTSVPGNAGTFVGFINLRTNYEEMPIINIGIGARFARD
jgi:hypothetical protein